MTQQVHSPLNESMVKSLKSSVLIIYTGGTIGMRNTPEHGYIPMPGFLSKCLSLNPRFCDQNAEKSVHVIHTQSPTATDLLINGTFAQKSTAIALTTPESLYGKRIRYSILEFEPLLDSANMTMSDWVKIGTCIEINYQLYDAFIVLHGTDTMAFTASALSFMLENLGKTVIITGSQVPFAELRNDAIDNLLESLIIAGHFAIPEVCLYFSNKLFRGNRASKMNALEFNAFDSPNHRPLVTVGVNIGCCI